MPRLPATPPLILRRRRLHRYIATSTVHLILHVRPVLDVLVEAADVAGDFVPGLHAEGDDGDEAEGEPFPAFCDLGEGGCVSDGLSWKRGRGEGELEGWEKIEMLGEM